jgi:hypothetical protein
MMLSIYAHAISQALTLAFTIAVAVSLMFFKGRPVMPAAVGVRAWVLVVAACALAAALFLVVRRNTYLPFLGEAAFPTGVLLVDREDGGGDGDKDMKDRPMRVTVQVPGVEDGMLVVYWASKIAEDEAAVAAAAAGPREAYASSNNAGVARARGGKAVLALGCPTEYVVRGSAMTRHVHYRVQVERGGLFGPVRTMFINC